MTSHTAATTPATGATPGPARRQVSDRLRDTPVIAVLRAASVQQLYPACDVLVEEGIRSLEFTLTTPGLLGSVDALVERYAPSSDVGVGTVLNTAQAAAAMAAGASYLVTPTMDLAVIEAARQTGVAVFPGGLTPTELLAGWQSGATAVKVFPAGTVGPGYLKHLHGPFPDLAVVPSGGVDVDDAKAWLNAGAVAVSVGGPLLGDALAGGDLSALRRRCRALLAAVHSIRPR